MDFVFMTGLLIAPIASVAVNPQSDVRVKIQGNDTHVTWAEPSNGVSHVDITIQNTTARLNSTFKQPFKQELQQCQKHEVLLKYLLKNLTTIHAMKSFYTTSNIFYVRIGEDKEIPWNITEGHQYTVISPSKEVVNSTVSDTRQLKILYEKIEPNHGGLYKVIDNKTGNEECFLLIVIDLNVTMFTLVDKLFEGDLINCSYSVQVWPNETSVDVINTLVYDGVQLNKSENTLNRTDRGKNVTCQASILHSDIFKNSNFLLLDPYYGPEKLDINVTDTINVTEGHNVQTMYCSAECYPNCTYKWKKTKEIKSDTQLLQIRNISRGESGKYKCITRHANDRERNLTSTVNINVQYRPAFGTVCNFTTNVSETFIEAGNYSWDEGEQVTIDLSVDSNPESKVTLYSNTFVIDHSVNKNGNVFSFTLSNQTCEDTGKYTFAAQNGVQGNITKSFFFLINCKPKLISIDRNDIVTDYGTTEIINVSVVSFPKPNITWVNFDSDWHIHEVNDYRFILTSSLTVLDNFEFGALGLNICNTKGCAYEHIKITKRRSLTGEEISYFSLPIIMAIIICLVLSILVIYSRIYQQKQHQISKTTGRESKEQLMDKQDMNDGSEKSMKCDEDDKKSDEDERTEETVNNDQAVSFKIENESTICKDICREESVPVPEDLNREEDVLVNQTPTSSTEQKENDFKASTKNEPSDLLTTNTSSSISENVIKTCIEPQRKENDKIQQTSTSNLPNTLQYSVTVNAEMHIPENQNESSLKNEPQSKDRLPSEVCKPKVKYDVNQTVDDESKLKNIDNDFFSFSEIQNIEVTSLPPTTNKFISDLGVDQQVKSTLMSEIETQCSLTSTSQSTHEYEGERTNLNNDLMTGLKTNNDNDSTVDVEIEIQRSDSLLNKEDGYIKMSAGSIKTIIPSREEEFNLTDQHRSELDSVICSEQITGMSEIQDESKQSDEEECTTDWPAIPVQYDWDDVADEDDDNANDDDEIDTA